MTQTIYQVAVRHENGRASIWNYPADSIEEARAGVLAEVAAAKPSSPARFALVGFAGGKA